MTKYWPKKQGKKLNNEVAYLFLRVRHKFSRNLSNKAENTLYIDLLDNQSRSQLFSTISIELESLILDLIELNLDFTSIKVLNDKIVSNLLMKSCYHFLVILNASNPLISLSKNSQVLKIMLFEDTFLLEYLLAYLIFGTSVIDNNVFVFCKNKTPKEHVLVLLENFVIQFSNLVICKLLKNFNSLSFVIYFIRANKLCNLSYISIRSIALLRNTLTLEKLIYHFISKPKQIYNSRYKIWLISSQGLITKYIYVSRLNEVSSMSKLQLFIVLLIEIQDMVIPKIEKTIFIFSKIIIYILINFLGNSAIFCIRSVLFGMNSLPR